jgi:hypothetical protein
LLIRIKYMQETSSSFCSFKLNESKRRVTLWSAQRSKSGFEDVELELEEEMHGKQASIHHQISFKGESQLAVITRKCKKGWRKNRQFQDPIRRLVSYSTHTVVTGDFQRKIETFKRYRVTADSSMAYLPPTASVVNLWVL